MNKRYISVILICLAALLSFQFAACSNFMSPSSPESGGNVTVTLSTWAGKAALAPDNPVFNSYEFRFIKVGEIIPMSIYRSGSEAVGGQFTFDLELGVSYNLQINAYTADDMFNPAAQGQTSAPFTVAASTPVSVDLTGVISDFGTGTFSWNISYPKDTILDEMNLYIDSNTIIPLDITENNSGTNRVNSGTKTGVPAGRYFLAVQLSRLNGETAGYANGVVIYNGLETKFEWTVTENDIKDPNKENEEISVEKWFGFDVKGKTGVGSIHANSTGTLYKNFKDTTGNYKDVLMLTPPGYPAPDGYPEGSTGLTYIIPLDTNYRFSVDVYIVPNPSETKPAFVYFETTDPDWNPVAGTTTTPLATGVWHTVSTGIDGITIGKGETFGLLTRDSLHEDNPLGNIGVNSHIIYLKNPRLSAGMRVGALWMEVMTLVGGDVPASGIKVAPENLRIYTNETQQLVLKGDISQGSPVWSSSDYSTVTVDQKGRITALKGGTATITVKSGTNTATSEVTVTPKYIALTFDDGPDSFVTPMLLNYLENANGGPAKATFFLMGMRAEAYPQNVKDAVAAGHEIGNHTYNHDPFSYANETDYATEKTVDWYKTNILQAQKAIADAMDQGGKGPKYFRPAYLGAYDNIEIAGAQLGLPRVGGELFDDWDPIECPTPEDTIAAAMAKAKPWGILIFHDYYQGLPIFYEPENDDGTNPQPWVGNGMVTVAAIPGVIDLLRADGYEIVTLGEMLAAKEAWLDFDEEQGMYDSFETVPPEMGTYVPVTGLTLNKSTAEVAVNATTTVTAAVAPATATRGDVVYWHSMNSTIATVTSNADGSTATITGKAVGTVSVYAIAEGFIKEVKVTVPGNNYTTTFTRTGSGSSGAGTLRIIFDSAVTNLTASNSGTTAGLIITKGSGWYNTSTFTVGSPSAVSGTGNKEWNIAISSNTANNVRIADDSTSFTFNIQAGSHSSVAQVDKTPHSRTVSLITYTTEYTKTTLSGDNAAGILKIIFSDSVTSLNAGTATSSGIRIQKVTGTPGGWYNNNDVTVGTPTVVSGTNNKEWTMTINSSTTNNIRIAAASTSATFNITTGSHTSVAMVDFAQHTQVILKN